MTTTTTAAAELSTHQLLIDGQFTGSRSGRTYSSTDPDTGQPWAEVPDADASDVDAAVTAARAAFDGSWGSTTATSRGKLLHQLGNLMPATRRTWRSWRLATTASCCG